MMEGVIELGRGALLGLLVLAFVSGGCLGLLVAVICRRGPGISQRRSGRYYLPEHLNCLAWPPVLLAAMSAGEKAGAAWTGFWFAVAIGAFIISERRWWRQPAVPPEPPVIGQRPEKSTPDLGGIDPP